MPKKKTKLSSLTKTSQKIRKKLSKNRLIFYKLSGLILVLLALLVLTYKHPAPIPVENVENNPIVINSELLESKETDNIPVRVVIPNSDVDLSVTPSEILNGYWELSETTASYGLGSGTPGKRGNTVIFAHAREGLFYNLKDVKEGDIIYVFTKNKWYRYKVNKITEVYPNQTEVIQPTKEETLTLYTCTGFNDEKRLIVTAKPI
jgi:LPXTG-site transpeptidase (sortase) family protein